MNRFGLVNKKTGSFVVFDRTSNEGQDFCGEFTYKIRDGGKLSESEDVANL